MSLAYASLAAFLAADPLRRRCAAVDLGHPWRTAAHGPAYRAAWLPSTGELFTVRLGPEARGGGAVAVLAQVAEASVLAEMLSGWQRACGGFDSIRWLTARVARAHPLKRRGRLAA